jgi:ankyrin repeat protein
MPSARSQFGSVYGSYETPRSTGISPYVTPNSSARAADFAAVYEDTPVYDAFVVGAKDFRPPPRPAATPSAKSDISNISNISTGGAILDAKGVFSTARHGRHKEVEKSLQAGFDPSSTDSFGNTLFHIACQNGNKRIAKLAIKYGGNMDAPNSKGNTGLHFLYAYGYPDVAEYFIEKGADDTVQNENGRVPAEGIK